MNMFVETHLISPTRGRNCVLENRPLVAGCAAYIHDRLPIGNHGTHRTTPYDIHGHHSSRDWRFSVQSGYLIDERSPGSAFGDSPFQDIPLCARPEGQVVWTASLR